MSVELIALSALKPPGEWGADLVVADSLPHTSPLDFSQPRLGAIARREILNTAFLDIYFEKWTP
jgi:glycine cleavage system pyridoxal-binding protein P